MHSVGYFSSYDRGLECLLEMWPEVRKQVPDAQLSVYYGWNSFDKVAQGNNELGKWKYSMIRKLHDLKDQGVTEHGRVDHETLAKKMKEIKVWAYPTEFTEINCITALKAQEAGCIPVTTDCYALEETVVDKTYSVPSTDIYTNKNTQIDFIKALVDALRSDHKTKPVPGVSWAEVAQQWQEAIAS